jgi:hypothetical protein
MNRILKKIGLNSTLTDKKLSLTFSEPFNFLVQIHTMTENGSITDVKVNKKNYKNQLESSAHCLQLDINVSLQPEAERSSMLKLINVS